MLKSSGVRPAGASKHQPLCCIKPNDPIAHLRLIRPHKKQRFSGFSSPPSPLSNVPTLVQFVLGIFVTLVPVFHHTLPCWRCSYRFLASSCFILSCLFLSCLYCLVLLILLLLILLFLLSSFLEIRSCSSSTSLRRG